MPIRVFEEVADSSEYHLLQQELLGRLLPARRFEGSLYYQQLGRGLL